jgi:hypothetical protein
VVVDELFFQNATSTSVVTEEQGAKEADGECFNLAPVGPTVPGRDPCFRPSHITWRTPVAYQVAQDKATGQCDPPADAQHSHAN